MEVEGLLNMGTVNMLREMDEGTGFFAELVAEYAAQSTGLLGTIHQGIDEGDLDKIGRAVHTLKGSSLNLGAEAVGQLCATLELALRDDDTETVAAHISGLQCDLRTNSHHLK